jgi:hypothetical protein
MLYAPYLNVGDEYHPDHTNSAPYFHKNHLDASYPILRNMSGLLLAHQGRTPRTMVGFLLDRDDKPDAVFERELMGYTFRATVNIPFPDDEAETQMVTPFAVLLAMGENDFAAIGTKMTLEIHAPAARTVKAESGRFENDRWVPGTAILLERAGGTVRHSFSNENRAVQQIRFRLATN